MIFMCYGLISFTLALNIFHDFLFIYFKQDSNVYTTIDDFSNFPMGIKSENHHLIFGPMQWRHNHQLGFKKKFKFNKFFV